MSDLISFGRSFKLDADDALNGLLSFTPDPMTNLGTAEMRGRLNTLEGGTASSSATAVERLALDFKQVPSEWRRGQAASCLEGTP